MTNPMRIQTSLLAALVLSCAYPISAANSSKEAAPQAVQDSREGAPVVFDNKTLFYISERVLSFSAEDRAQAISERIRKIAKSSLPLEAISTVDGEGGIDLVAGDLVLMTVTDRDAQKTGRKRDQLAAAYVEIVRATIQAQRETYSVKTLSMGALWTLVATLVLLLFLVAGSWLFPKIYSHIHAWRGTYIRSLKIQSMEILPEERIADLLTGLFQTLRGVLTVALVYYYATLVLGFFPWTRKFSVNLIHYVLSPLHLLWDAFIGFLPNIFFITVTAVITNYVLKLVRLIFVEIRRGRVEFPGFYREWADPTYKIVRFLVLAFVAVIIFPYLPGAGSDAFKGVSVFLGVLFSLGSTAAIANVVAGTVLTYMRPFKVGDRVKISDTIGDVIEKSLLVTRIQTIKNVDITIPNAMVLGSHIINFSSSAQESGLILHTSVTIGYDAPWKKVHETLLAAAKATSGLLEKPSPFVLQTSLNDFHITYELNVYTDKPNEMAVTYSRLHENIQDAFNKAGLEIMSPHYAAVRDGNTSTIPEDHLPKNYQAPSFRIGPISIPSPDARTDGNKA